MKINVSIIFYLLSKKHPNSIIHLNNPSSFTDKLRFFHNSKTKPNCLYILNYSDYLFIDNHLLDHHSQFIMLGNHQNKASLLSENYDYILINGVSEISAIFDEVLDLFDLLNQWDNRLKEMIYTEKSLHQVFFELSSLLPMPYCLIDQNYHINLTTDPKIFGQVHHSTELLPEIVESLLSDPEYQNAISNTGVYLYPKRPSKERFLCVNIFEYSSIPLRLLLNITDSPESPAPGLLELFRHFSGYIQKSCHTASDLPQFRHQQDSLHQMFIKIFNQNRSFDINQMNVILTPYQWLSTHSFKIIKLQFFKGSSWDSALTYVCSQLESEYEHSCAIKRDSDIVWILNITLSEAKKDGFSLSRLAPLIRDYSCKAGLSDTFFNLQNITTFYKQTTIALDIGQSLQPDFWYYQFEDYKLDYLRYKITEDFSSELLSPPGFEKLQNSDIKHHTEYLKTLSSYLEYGTNITAAAKALFIHRTTFIRRLERIEKISGLKLSDSRTLFWIGLSLFALEDN